MTNNTYSITPYTISQAKMYGLTVKQSTNTNKKIDVFRAGKKIASIGAIGYNDYPTYIKSKGQKYADSRRVLYMRRHAEDIKVKWSNGWLASVLLW